MRTVLRCIAQMSHVYAVLTDYCRLRSNFCVFLHLLLNPLDSKGSYSATSNNTKWVHWPLMGGLLHLVQWGGAWAGCSPTQSARRCTKCNRPPPSTASVPVYHGPLLFSFNVVKQGQFIFCPGLCFCASCIRIGIFCWFYEFGSCYGFCVSTNTVNCLERKWSVYYMSSGVLNPLYSLPHLVSMLLNNCLRYSAAVCHVRHGKGRIPLF